LILNTKLYDIWRGATSDGKGRDNPTVFGALSFWDRMLQEDVGETGAKRLSHRRAKTLIVCALPETVRGLRFLDTP